MMICPECKGAKTICKMGGISGYCPKCSGRGHINGTVILEHVEALAKAVEHGPTHDEAKVAAKELNHLVDEAIIKSATETKRSRKKVKQELSIDHTTKLRAAIPQNPLSVKHMNPEVLDKE